MPIYEGTKPKTKKPRTNAHRKARGAIEKRLLADILVNHVERIRSNLRELLLVIRATSETQEKLAKAMLNTLPRPKE